MNKDELKKELQRKEIENLYNNHLTEVNDLKIPTCSCGVIFLRLDSQGVEQ